MCHAYQILKSGGLKDENIIVFMYDDIAYNEENPRPGVIINNPHGEDVYKGVPKVCLDFLYLFWSFCCLFILGTGSPLSNMVSFDAGLCGT